MKPCKAALSGLLIAAAFLTAGSPRAMAADVPTVSPWAREEAGRAQDLGIIPEAFPEDYTVPITREQYIGAAMKFVALQQHCQYGSLTGMVSLYMAEKSDDGYFVKSPFTDTGGDLDISLAHYLGLVQGRGNGIFDPGGHITRQEAAVILTRAYEVIGGSLPEYAAETGGFTDEEDIAAWAKESAIAQRSWNVMEGMEDGSFAPQGEYTIEQCVVTFLRLYENAPVSRKNGNVKPLFTYEQGIEYALQGAATHEAFRIEGPCATFIRTDLGGVMRATSRLLFVYPDGGVQGISSVVYDSPWGFTPSQKLEDTHFSEDGKTFYFTAAIEKDVISYMSDPQGELLNEKGVYHVTVDVDTCGYQVRREALPE